MLLSYSESKRIIPEIWNFILNNPIFAPELRTKNKF